MTPSPITSTQPGGGLFAELELAWGRLRRRFLRRIRPGYVARMAQNRQGECPDCKHDIIDPRDLKYFRNVCGYWFRDEDDPFRWRGRLRLARPGLAELIGLSFLFASLLFVLAAGTRLHWLFWIPLAVIAVLWVFVISFFRDPERRIPADAGVVVSPADGTVTDVGLVDELEYPGGRAFRIGIFLSVFNVHVNRIPTSGKITKLRYFPGEFLDARAAECGKRNEQLWIDMEEDGTGRHVRVKQIAGAIARRIVCWLKPGESVSRGERLGMIKFGSRTELYLPADENIEVLVKPGETVRGGSTVLLRYR